MRNRSWVAVLFMASPAVLAADPPPKPTGMAERIEKRLVQLDISVQGDPDAIRALTAKDFSLYVGPYEVQGLIVDRLCGDEPAAITPTPDESTLPPPPAARPRATFIFYFDQSHLTMGGRHHSLETTRDLINRLVVGGARASIVSSARRLQTIVPMTDDREKLLAGLERLRNDSRQWDAYAMTEDPRIDLLKRTPPEGKCPLAKSYVREEWLQAKQSTERIGFAVGTLAEIPAPKGLVYFGDTLRQKAGFHYFLGDPCAFADPLAMTSADLIPSAAAEFDALVNQALARGVHFFTIQAEGLVETTARLRDAQNTLVGLAAETGGEAFLGGASNTYIADKIESLTSCRLLLSFPPGDLPTDTPLAVSLQLHAPNVKFRTQGRIVVPSAESIERARLVAAFVDPASSDDGSLRALLIPRSGDGKIWRASVQLRLRPTGLPDTSAELGASIVRGDTVTDQFNASIATKNGSRALVLEKTLDVAPGEFAVVAVARDAKRGDTTSTRLEAEWPNPAKAGTAIAPIAVLQAANAAMSKDGAVSASGMLARDVDEPLDPGASATLKTVVCRGSKNTETLVVGRLLEDGLENEFTPTTMEATGDPCVQVVDVVRPGRLRPGVVDYRVTVRIGDDVVATARRPLRVVGAP